MKATGACLMVMGAFFLTITKIKELRAEMVETEDLVNILELMAAELSAKAASVPELTESLLRRCRGSARIFISALYGSLNSLGDKELSELWNMSAAESFRYFSPEDRNEFESIGALLGRCELEMQLSSIVRASKYFRDKLELMRKEFPQRSKLSFGLCTGGGLLVLIILI